MAKKRKYTRKVKVGKKVKKAIKSEIKSWAKQNTELKQLVTYSQSVDIYAAAAYSGATNGFFVMPLTAIPQNVGGEGRVGDVVSIKSLTVRGNVILFPGTGHNVFVCMHVYVFQMRNSNNIVQPNADDQFIPSGIVGAGIHDAFDHINQDYTQVYNMLYSKRMTLVTNTGNPASVQVSNCIRTFSFRVPLKYAKKRLKFDQNNAQADNAIYIACVSDESNNATSNPEFEFSANLTYTDS